LEHGCRSIRFLRLRRKVKCGFHNAGNGPWICLKGSRYFREGSLGMFRHRALQG